MSSLEIAKIFAKTVDFSFRYGRFSALKTWIVLSQIPSVYVFDAFLYHEKYPNRLFKVSFNVALRDMPHLRHRCRDEFTGNMFLSYFGNRKISVHASANNFISKTEITFYFKGGGAFPL